MAPTVVAQEAEAVHKTRATQAETELLLLLGEVTNILVAAVAELAPHLATLVGDAVVLSVVAEQAAVAAQVYMTQHMMVHP